MTRKNRLLNSFLSVILILSLTLANVNIALADEGPTPEPAITTEPTEEPFQPTAEPTQPPVVATESPVVETPVATEAAPTEPAPDTEQEAPIAELLTQAPENTDLVVLDENGQALPLTSQEALNTILETDPMWCPAGVLPGGAGCTTNFASINLLMANMASSPGTYDENGIIYFTSTPGASFTLTSESLATYDTLNDFNLTLQGGWNGLNGASATFTSQTNFGSNTLAIGSSANPWAGNITLNNFSFSGVSSGAAVTVYTTSGSITLDNVDVSNQTGGFNTGLINSTSGNITVQNGSAFDGNNTSAPTNGQSSGFSATTGSGSITISDTVFQESRQNGSNTSDGATLSAPTVTLTNVTAQNNDGDGITINNANLVTLNNVTASGNGTDNGATGLSNNDGSGILINGNPGSSVFINGGTFTNNQEYGVEVGNAANTTIYIQSNPICSDNDSNAAPTSNCYNDTTISDNTAPVITPTISGTAGSNGWYISNVTLSWSVLDVESGIASSSGCNSATLNSDTVGKTFTCSATNNVGLSGSNSVTIKVDKTIPTITFVSRTPADASGWNSGDVTVNWSCTDALSGVVAATVNQVVTTEGSNQSATGTCQDLAGNIATNTQTGINIDKTAPIAIATVSPAPNANGWNNTDVTVSFTGTDAGSGIAFCSPAVTISTEGAGQASASGTCTDSVGRISSPVSATGINIDKTSPGIAFATISPAPNGNGWNNTDVTVSWTCTDALSGPVSSSVNQTVSAEGATQSAMGTCQDLAGNSASHTHSGINIDKTAPMLNLPPDLTVEATSSVNTVVIYSASTTDNLDAAPSVACAPPSGSPFVVGTTMVNCTATDHADNIAFGNFNITVQDSTAPTISFHADVIEEATSASGATVNYSAPTTSDAVDGAGTASCSPASGQTFPLGSTSVTCTAIDSQNNAATPTSFTVHVVDTTAPVIAVHADIFVVATSPAGALVSYTSPTTLDAVDGAGTASCSPVSGSLFPIGNTTITCNATDSHNNTATPTSFIVHVVDTDAPVINGHLDVTVEATSATGAIANYSNPGTTDAIDGPGVATCSPASGTFFGFGNTTVTCNATDSNGNAALPTTFVVHVVDTTSPVIASHADVTAITSNSLGAIVSYSSPSTSDAVDGAGIATCTPASGGLFAVGDTFITCNTTDANGNAAQSVTFTIHVIYQPVTQTPAPSPSTGAQENRLNIPVTSGLIDLDCLSVIESAGIKVTFHNLCDFQALVTAAMATTLPAQLPDQYTFVQGLNALVLFENELVMALPAGTGVQLDFPVPANTQDQYAVLLWDDEDGDGNGEWLDATLLLQDKDLSKAMAANTGDELYHLVPTKTLEAFYRIITTEKTGTFVLVKK